MDTSHGTDRAEQEVLSLDRHLNEDSGRSNLSALDSSLADNFISVQGRNADIMDKARYIKESHEREKAKSGGLKVETKIDHSEARVFGDTAVVVGDATSKRSYQDQEFTVKFRYTSTYVRLQAGWQLVAQHSTLILLEASQQRDQRQP